MELLRRRQIEPEPTSNLYFRIRAHILEYGTER